MFARGARGELAHQLRHFGILSHLEGIEAVRLVCAEIEHQLFHGVRLVLFFITAYASSLLLDWHDRELYSSIIEAAGPLVASYMRESGHPYQRR